MHVLETAKRAKPSLLTKSSIMLGLGETSEDIENCLNDLRNVGVDIVTFGQYLRPSRRHLSVQRYIPPEEFDEWKLKADAKGFKYVASGPLVRSSYKAGELFIKGMIEANN